MDERKQVYTKAEKEKVKKWLEKQKGLPKNVKDLNEWVLEAGQVVPSIGDTAITGRRISRSSLCMTMELGTAKAKDGTEYSISSVVGGALQITNHRTSRDYRLSLNDVLQLAILKGINSKNPIANPADPDEVALVKELRGEK